MSILLREEYSTSTDYKKKQLSFMPSHNYPFQKHSQYLPMEAARISNSCPKERKKLRYVASLKQYLWR